MYTNILKDVIFGFIDSIRINLFFSQMYVNEKFRRLIIKLVKYNFLLHILPFLLVDAISWFSGVSLRTQLRYVNYLINLFSGIFHVIHFIDLISIISVTKSKNKKFLPMIDVISLAITMSIYQIVIYLTTELIKFIFHERINSLAIVLNFIILTMYHSFYCFNGLWQCLRIPMLNRIDIHEKLWPYHIGYGMISTIIYLNSGSPYILGIYNLCVSLIISLPFLIKVRYPPKIQSYPKINLFIFSFVIGRIVLLAKKIIGIK